MSAHVVDKRCGWQLLLLHGAAGLTALCLLDAPPLPGIMPAAGPDGVGHALWQEPVPPGLASLMQLQQPAPLRRQPERAKPPAEPSGAWDLHSQAEQWSSSSHDARNSQAARPQTSSGGVFWMCMQATADVGEAALPSTAPT